MIVYVYKTEDENGQKSFQWKTENDSKNCQDIENLVTDVVNVLLKNHTNLMSVICSPSREVVLRPILGAKQSLHLSPDQKKRFWQDLAVKFWKKLRRPTYRPT